MSRTTSTTPRFRRIAEGDYETADGRFRLYRLRGVNPPAWNVEDVSGDDEVMIVDGAATKRDAVAMFADHIDSFDRVQEAVEDAVGQFLATADLATLQAKRAWLADYAGRTYNGHSEIAANLARYDAAIADRQAGGVA